MKDERCPTCNNPIGLSLKKVREERDRMIAFNNKVKGIKEELSKRSKELDAREKALAEKEADFVERNEILATDEAALEELTKEAKRPEQEFKKLETSNQKLLEQVEALKLENEQITQRADKAREQSRTKLAAEREKAKNAVQAMEMAQTECKALAKTNRKLTRNTASLESETNRLSKSLERTKASNLSLKEQLSELQEEYDNLDSDHFDLLTENEKLSIKVENLKNSNDKLKDQLKRKTKPARKKAPKRTLPDSPFSIIDMELLKELSYEVTDKFEIPDYVVTLGSGPFPEKAFDDYLREIEITPRNRDHPWIIVGRDNWTKKGIDDLVANADPEELRVFSQELFMLGFLTGHDPFSLPEEILLKFAEGHPALEYLLNSEFEWPVVLEQEIYGEPEYLRGVYDQIEESPLAQMGYRVGITRGLEPDQRRRLLEKAYTEELDDVGDEDYMEEWGRPNHPKRLWRIAHHLAWLIRTRQDRHNFEYAVEDWQEDLDWLEEEFYTARMQPRFSWPYV